VAVGLYLNTPEQLAREKITSDGFQPVVNHHASTQTESGLVFRQLPVAGKRIPKGSEVTIWVSTGLPKVEVPGVVGQQSTSAVETLTRQHLKPKVRDVPSSKPTGEVLAQDPREGTQVVVNTTVWINVSKGPQPVLVPAVVGEPIQQATSELRAAGFQVSPRYVDDNQPANTVIGQSPTGGTSAGKGSVVSVTVSNGPKTSAVPDVTSYDLGSAQQTLQSAGFRSAVSYQDVTDPNSDGIVLDQSPTGGTQEPKDTKVTLVVGRLVAGGGDTTTTETLPTTTTLP